MRAEPHRRSGWTVAVLLSTGMGACASPPEAGELDPVYARPAETVDIRTLRNGETLGAILWESIDANEQYALLMAFQRHASPRRIRSGTEVTLRYLAEDGSLRGVDVAINRDETVRLARGPVGWESSRIRTPVFVDTLTASGRIEDMLWTSVVRNPALAGMPGPDRNRVIDYLDRVFQWQVDFTRQVRVGDTYRFAFERVVRPDGSLRSGRLLAAEFVNAGTPYHAIWFDATGEGDGAYYDLEGTSVRRAFLRRPLTFRRISSRFTNSRYHPILGIWRAHRGVDYAAEAGTPVETTADGVVIHRGWKGSYGNAVEIRHPNGFVTRYGHLSGFRRGMSVGTRVRQGEVIGYVGQTGLARGNHLHYELIRGGRQVDPLDPLVVGDLPAGEPVPSAERFRWMDERDARVSLLDGIPGAGPVRAATAQRAVEPDGAGGSE